MASLLERLFPSLRKVSDAAGTPPPPSSAKDDAQLRRRSFTALRAPFARLAALKPLVLFIDDVQWGDADRLTRLCDIRDGASNTIAMGEGVGGPLWPLCRGAGCRNSLDGPSGSAPAADAWIYGSVGNRVHAP